MHSKVSSIVIFQTATPTVDNGATINNLITQGNTLHRAIVHESIDTQNCNVTRLSPVSKCSQTKMAATSLHHHANASVVSTSVRLFMSRIFISEYS